MRVSITLIQGNCSEVKKNKRRGGKKGGGIVPWNPREGNKQKKVVCRHKIWLAKNKIPTKKITWSHDGVVFFFLAPYPFFSSLLFFSCYFIFLLKNDAIFFFSFFFYLYYLIPVLWKGRRWLFWTLIESHCCTSFFYWFELSCKAILLFFLIGILQLMWTNLNSNFYFISFFNIYHTLFLLIEYTNQTKKKLLKGKGLLKKALLRY